MLESTNWEISSLLIHTWNLLPCRLVLIPYDFAGAKCVRTIHLIISVVKTSHDVNVAVHANAWVTVSTYSQRLEAFELSYLTHREEVCVPYGFKILYRAASSHNKSLLTDTTNGCVFEPPLVTAMCCELCWIPFQQRGIEVEYPFVLSYKHYQILRVVIVNLVYHLGLI